MQDKRLTRIDESTLGVPGHAPFPVRIFANAAVSVEPAAVDELLSVVSSHRTLERLGRGPSSAPWSIERVAVTPDFHKGAGIPIGTVLHTRGVVFPQAVGNDINCGMRLHVTNVEAAAVTGVLDGVADAARHLFFEGGRQIPMTGDQRASLLTGGLGTLLGSEPWRHSGGQWPLVERLGWHRQLDRVERRGSLAAERPAILDDWLQAGRGATHDDQIGSVGGGNHFVELQRVERILDRQTAYAWGLRKGALTIMVHSGSVGIGHIVGRSIRALLKEQYPAGVAHPENGLYPLDVAAAEASGYWDLLHSAANFAFANRLFLAASAVEALERVLGRIEAPLVYDAPHNLVWPAPDGGFVHRKGATPARGAESMAGTPFEVSGEPVLVPGSMGASSFVLAGLGRVEALESASHGAGRALSRSDASRTARREFDAFLDEFRIVTPLDLRRPDVRRRADIYQKKVDELRAEGPHAYKGIRAVVDTLAVAGIARPVAELAPVMTIKG